MPYDPPRWKKPVAGSPAHGSQTAGPAERLAPDLKFLAAVAIRFETPLSVGETPDGVRLDFPVHGTVDGPSFRGNFPATAAYLLVDRDGVGTIHVRAPLLLNDGAKLELEAVGR